MSTTKTSVTVVCDFCGRVCLTDRTTTKGARGDARRRKWAVAAMYRGGESGDQKGRDMCPPCRVVMRDARAAGQTPEFRFHDVDCSARIVGSGCICEYLTDPQ